MINCRTHACCHFLVLFALSILLFLISSPALAANDITLTQDGKAVALIVADTDNLSPSEKWAVSELRTFIEKMSGAKLKVVAPGDVPEDLPLIIVGRSTAESRHKGLDFDALGDDGFYIKTVGNELILAGGRKRGTMYAVYTMLEDLGCRWWTPTESYIPAKKTLVVSGIDRREVPRLEFRNIMYAEGFAKSARIWYVRNKLNGVGWEEISDEHGGEYFVAGQQGHNTIELVTEGIGKENITEDMWAMAHVRRTDKTERVKNEVCQTHPKVIEATVKRLVQLYKKNPDTKYLVVAHEDNNNYCRCDKCAAIYQREGNATGQWLYFCNTVAEELEKQVPGARIMVDAYGWTRKPPRTLKPRHNVLVRFAPIESDWAHPLTLGSNPQNREVRDDIKFWGRTASMLSIWTYIGNRAHYMMPNPDLDSVVPNIKFYADNNAVGIMQQGTQAGTGTEFVALRMWLLGKAMWNPDLDGKKLISEFLEGYYGSAAPSIQKYIDIMHSYGRKNDYHLGRFTRMNVPFLQPSIIAEAEAALRQAEAAVADDPMLLSRVQHVHLSIWYVLAKRGPMSPTWQAVEKKVGKLDFAEIARLSNQAGKKWKVTAVGDPEESGPYFQWLTDYAALLKEKGRVLPPEFKGRVPQGVRLIQARQIDGVYLSRSGQWRKMDDASDGWALTVLKAGWLIQHTFSPYDEYTPGRNYKLFVRLKGGPKKSDGTACTVGLTGTGKLPSLNVKASDLEDGEFKVFEVGTFTAQDVVTLYFSLSRDGSMPEVYFDCLWLQQVR